MEAQSRQQEETKNINVSLHTFGKVYIAKAKYDSIHRDNYTHLVLVAQNLCCYR